MDFQVLSENSLKIKIKKTTLALDPQSSVAKFDADAILLLNKNSDTSRVNNSRVIISGAGEYEVSGLKISGLTAEGDILYELSLDSLSVIVTKASSLEKISAEKLGDYNFVVINVDTELNQSKITAMEPRIVILYGQFAKEGAKALGKEGAVKSSKISVSEDKLPEELEIMLLS